MTLSTAVTMSIPKRIGELIDYCLKPEFYSLIEPLCTETAVLILCGGAANFLRLLLQARASEGIQLDLRNRSYDNLIVQQPEYFDKHRLSSPEIVSRLASDSNFVGVGITEQTVGTIRSTLQLIAGTYMALSISPELMLKAGVAIPFIIGVSRITGKKVSKYSNLGQASLANSSKIANETLGPGFKTVH